MHVTLNEESQAAWQAQNLEHLRYEYDLKPDDVVIDLGAYRGEWASEIRARYGCCVIAVEPTDAIDGYECEIIKQAAWVNDGTQAFGGAYYYTSIYEKGGSGSGDNIEQWGMSVYACFDINTLLARFDDIALVKINIEGAEYPIIQHIIDHRQHLKIRNLQVQFHQVEGQPWQAWYDGIAAALNSSHSLTFSFPFCWENWQRKGPTPEQFDEGYVEQING
jgi:hypothetical protein